MIEHTDTPLNQEQYEYFKTLTQYPVFKVVAHRHSLDFAEGTAGSSDSGGGDFDSVSIGDYIYRLSGDELERYDTNTDTWSTLTFTAPVSYFDGTRPALAVRPSDNRLYAYMVCTDGVQWSSSPDGSTWDAWEFMPESPSLVDHSPTQVAAPTWDRVHMVYRDDSRFLFHLVVSHRIGGTWEQDLSDIWWTFSLNSFDAICIDEDEGIDILVADTQIPGTITVINEDNEAVYHVYTSGGIVGFRYQYRTWSDYINVDLVDDMQEYRFRRRVKASFINGVAFVTAYTGDGSSSDYPIAGVRYYTSTDGIYWSQGKYLPLPDTAGLDGTQLILNGDNVYALERQAIFLSPSTPITGHSSPDGQEDITHRLTDYSLSNQGVLSASMSLDNSDGHLTDHPFINQDSIVTFEHFAGFYPEDTATWGTEPLLIQVGLTEMDSISIVTTLDEREVSISARGRLAWMSETVTSEQARYWQSQLVGADDFADNTDTNYGGLSHTATQQESFITDGLSLKIDAHNKVGIAFNTFTSDMWNGSVQSGINVPDASAIAGVVFRAYDTDNMWTAYYSRADDRIILGNYVDGVFTSLDNSALMGWSINTDYHIRVEFKYGYILVYASSDGADWTIEVNYKINCSGRLYGDPYLRPLGSQPLERGYCGYIGKGVNT